MNSPISGSRRAAFTFLALGLLWVLPSIAQPAGVLVASGNRFTDLLVAHAPSALFLRQELAASGQIPSWNPHILGGIPFLADPLSGVWYPPNWLAVVLPIGLGFNLILWLHLAWAGWGMWRLVRALGAGGIGAMASGIAYSGSPKLLAHLGLGHLGLVCGMSWAPWTLEAIRSAVLHSTATRKRSIPAYTRIGVSLGLAALADPRAALMIGLLGAAYAAYLIAVAARNPFRRANDALRRFDPAGPVVALLLALGLSAALWLPFAEYVSQSTRAGLSLEASGGLALPPGNLLQIFLPSAPVGGEWLTYAGLVCALLAFLSLRLRIPEGRWWGAVALAGWTIALGPATPLFTLLTRLVPGMGLVRVPPRFLFYPALGLAILVGLVLNSLIEGAYSLRDRRRLVRLAMIPVAFAAISNLLLSGILGGPSILPIAGALTGVSWAVLSGVAIALTLYRALPARAISFAWLGLLTLDLATFNLPRLQAAPPAAVWEEGAAVARFLAHEAGDSRVLALSYGVPALAAVRFDLRLADGVHPLPLRSYWDRMAGALGFDRSAYSVTLPPYPGGNPDAPWEPSIRSDELGVLNVGWIVSAFPLASDDLRLERIIDGQWIYSNPEGRPRAWVQEDFVWGGAIQSAARQVWVQANEIVIDAEGPGHLVLAETHYPGWRVWVDGRPGEVEVYGGLWRAAALPPGSHRVRFSYHSWRIELGVGISLLAALGALLLGRGRD